VARDKGSTKKLKAQATDVAGEPKPIAPASQVVVPFVRNGVNTEPKALDPTRFEPRAIRLPETHLTPKPPKPIAPAAALPEPAAPRSLMDRLRNNPPPAPKPQPVAPPRALAPPRPSPPRVEPVKPVPNPYNVTIDDKIDRLMERAFEIDPQTTSNIRFRPRLDKAVSQTAREWMDWGQRGLETLRTVTVKNAEFVNKYTTLNAAQWIQETQNAANKPPSFMDRFNRKPVSFYEGQMDRIRADLADLLVPLEAEIADLRPRFDTLRLDVLTFSVLYETLSDPHDIQVVQTRQRTLVNGQTSVAQLLQMMENTRASITQNIQTIDDLLLTLIPQWKMAESQR
jgi:hypothetical protein